MKKKNKDKIELMRTCGYDIFTTQFSPLEFRLALSPRNLNFPENRRLRGNEN